jgi:putative isomerase
VPPVASVALNSFLYRDAVELAALATRMNKPDDAQAWRDAADRIAKALTEVCYVESEKRFWDFNHHTQTHRRVKTFWMFWPLWAGVPMPEATKRSLIEEALLDEQQFFGPVPFPSVAYDEPTYVATAYWRGKAWPHVSTWLVEMLAREGYLPQAREAATRLLTAWSTLGGPTENLSTDPSKPTGGFQDYNWGCAAVLLLDRFLTDTRDDRAGKPDGK